MSFTFNVAKRHKWVLDAFSLPTVFALFCDPFSDMEDYLSALLLPRLFAVLLLPLRPSYYFV